MLQVLFEDQDILVVFKPAGVESQAAKGIGADMVSEIRRYLLRKERDAARAQRTGKTGMLSTKPSTKPAGSSTGPQLSSTGAFEPYVGVIHRLDKPVSGVMVYAKNPKAAAGLSKQAAGSGMQKSYLAVVCGNVDKPVDNLVDYLLKDGKENVSRIVDKGISEAKRAELSYRILKTEEDPEFGSLSLAEVTLKTGRHHQIRVQMSGHGMPLWGDQKYNPAFADKSFRGNVGLASYRLSFRHPADGREMSFEQRPKDGIFRRFASEAEV